MDSAATVTTKGQVTIPAAVRTALGLEAGDRVMFRVDGTRAVLARTVDLMELGGSVPVPAGRRGASWEEVRRRTRATRAAAAT